MISRFWDCDKSYKLIGKIYFFMWFFYLCLQMQSRMIYETVNKKWSARPSPKTIQMVQHLKVYYFVPVYKHLTAVAEYLIPLSTNSICHYTACNGYHGYYKLYLSCPGTPTISFKLYLSWSSFYPHRVDPYKLQLQLQLHPWFPFIFPYT